MKSTKHFSLKVLLCILLLCVTAAPAAASPSRPRTKWRMENGQRTYYRNGGKYTGWLKKNGRAYYIRRGHALTSWRRIGGKTWYFNEKGVLQKNKNYTASSASKIPGYASFMLRSHAGDCYNYAAAMAYIARVLGYPVRLSFGGVTAYADHGLSDHAVCEVWDEGAWKIIDCSMGRIHPGYNCFMVKRSAYPFRLRIDKSYKMVIKNQKVSWIKQ